MAYVGPLVVIGLLPAFRHVRWPAVAGATAGFLIWNYPVGLIFLGDGGAYFWGVVLALLSLLPLLELASAGAGTARSADGGPALAALDRLGVPTTAGVLLGLIVAGIWLKGLFLWLAMRHVGNTVADVATELRMRLLRALLHARWSFFTVLSPGDLSSAIGMEAHRAASAYRQAAAALARVVGVVLYAGLAFLVSWRMALLALFVGLVCTVGLAGLVRLAREGGQAQTATMRSLLAHITDALNTMKALRAMGCEEEAGRILRADVEGLRRAQRGQVFAYESLRALHEPVTAAFLAAGLYAALAMGGHPPNTLLLLLLLFHRTMGGIQQVQAEYQSMVAGESAFQSLVHLTRRAEAAPEARRGALNPPPLRSGIRLEKVSFAYGGRDVLKGVTCFLPAGELIVLTGPSGAGKTTLTDLILGLHAPSSGSVRVDGVLLERVDLPAWRRQVGYLPQDAILLHGTVYQNVALGRPHVRRADVDEALRAAGAWGFVAERAEGVDYDVGAAGGRLSGGQRQRIALAPRVGRPPAAAGARRVHGRAGLSHGTRHPAEAPRAPWADDHPGDLARAPGVRSGGPGVPPVRRPADGADTCAPRCPFAAGRGPPGEWMTMTRAEFSAPFRGGSPIERAGRRGLLRNVAVALGYRARPKPSRRWRSR